MFKRLRTLVSIRLADADAERVRRSHEEAIHELQDAAVMRGTIVRDVELPDGQLVFVPHGLGRRATAWPSAPRASLAATTGRIREIRDATVVDRTRFVGLKAQGWGETVTVDVWIV